MKKVAQVRKVTKATKVKRVIKAIRDFLEHSEIRDPEVIRVYEVNKVKEAKKVIWDTAVLLVIKAQLESRVVRASPVRLDYRVIKVIKGTKERPVPWVTRAIKERWGCRERLESQVMQVCQEK